MPIRACASGSRSGLWARAALPWVQQPAGTCPNSWRDGFARDCPLRHPVAPMLALRDRAGASVGFSVDFRRVPQARSAEPRQGRRGWGEARRRCPRDRLASPFSWSGLCTPKHPSCGKRMVDRTSARPHWCRPFSVSCWSQTFRYVPVVPENPGSKFLIARTRSAVRCRWPGRPGPIAGCGRTAFVQPWQNV